MGPGEPLKPGLSRRHLLHAGATTTVGLALRGGAAAGLAALTGLAACTPPSGVSAVGGFVGPDPQRGHAVRKATQPAPSSRSQPVNANPPSPTPTPTPTPTPPVRRVHTLLAGGGVAGLAAARALRLRGQDDWALLELEDEAGGNARAGRLGGLACPLGAHYLPLPGDHNPDLQDLLEELGLRRRVAGRWAYDERHLCHSPQERLFFQGRWQPGLLPTEGVGASTLAQYRRFAALVADAQRQTAPTARYQIPHLFYGQNLAISHGVKAIDALLFSDFLSKNGLDDPQLRWYLDYCCRDEYGAGADTVSAWAGLHYFAARHGFAAPDAGAGQHLDGDPHAVLTWPEGNAWLTQRLAQSAGERLLAGWAVQRIEATAQGVQVDAVHVASGQAQRWLARHCVVALPMMVAVRVVVNPPPALVAAARRLRSAAWVVTNLHLRQPLLDRGGAAPAWDNVVYGSAGLGYVNAGHQLLHPYPTGPTVLTHYRALGLDPQARAGLLAQPWTHWRDAALVDLAGPHPDLAEHLTATAVARYGHAMAVPQPGNLSEIGLLRTAVNQSSLSSNAVLSFAHSDWAGYSVFEEAFALGHAAGRRQV